ncbi:MAG: HAMP domain-containing protein, partial [Proteobacteria bacterium]|nr:HAMP domain-containing protein [Pseudomonadota bacterium]
MDENSELKTGATAAPDAVKNTDTATKTTGGGLSIANKLLGIVLMLIALLATVAGIGGYQMNRIGDELIEIAEHDIPMTTGVTQITIHQLEQAIALERAFRFGEEMRTDSRARERFEESKKEFEHYAELTDKEFKEAEIFIEEAIRTTHDERDLKEFERVLEALTEIDESHASFEEHAREALTMLRERADLDEILELEEKVEAEETELDHNLEALLAELEKFTEESAKNAEAHEKEGFMYMIVSAVVAAVIGLGLALLLARNGIARPLAEVMLAMEALSRGDKSATLTVRSNDEVGKIAATFLIFRERLVENDRMRDEQEAARAVELARVETLDKLFDGFDKGVSNILETVSSAATELEQTAQSLSSSAEQASGQAASVATASNQ